MNDLAHDKTAGSRARDISGVARRDARCICTANSPHGRQRNPGMENAAGFVLYVALLTILTAGAVGGFFLYSAYTHSQAVRRWHDADQCLLDAQSALEQVKYEIIQSYEANGRSSATWFQNWSSNAIGAAPGYTIPSPVTVNGTPVFVTLAGVTVITNAGTYLVTLTLAADGRKSATWLFRRTIQEQMQISIAAGTSPAPASANCALGMYGTNDTVTVGSQLTIDGNNWNPPATFNSGAGSRNPPSSNDMPGVVYSSTKIGTGAKISIDGNPPQTNAAGAFNIPYWTQCLNTLLPLATTYTGGSLGTRAAPVITKLPSGATSFSTPMSGAGILIIPGDADITINQDFYYEGLIILVSDNTKAKDLMQNQTTTLYGCLVCLGNRCGLNIKGTLNVWYSKQALANLVNLPFASSGGSNGVPCTSYWREIH
ncbi:MAG: hypothetical protein PHW60_01600 [Kiritimatiellae bacterium]|nr:hypothetical protein [Kiritimatiellia bacterium]